MDRGASKTCNAPVVVVGGGPAGCAAAIACAQAGLQVTLLEREPFPRHRPGETLHPGVEALFRQLGVWEQILRGGFLRHEGNWIRWDGPPRFEAFGRDATGPWRGFQVWRAELDTILLEQARALGVIILQPCRAVRPLIEAGRVIGVATSKGLIQAHFVVDAAGGRHWLARYFGLPRWTQSPPLVARYGYVRGACPQRDTAPAIVADPSGWTWTARVCPGWYAWVRLSLDGTRLPEGWLPEELRALAPHGRTGAANVTWRVVTPLAGPGWFLAGDAAAVLDPASSHGTLKALMSGMLTAHAIVQVIQHGADEAHTARSFTTWLSHWFEYDVTRLQELYRGFAGRLILHSRGFDP
jgi:flavin-dependent dehydrogenase